MINLVPEIKERFSPVIYSNEEPSAEQIEALFEAARWAPSSFNEQPWHFVYALKSDGEGRKNMESLLMDGNAWAKEAGMLLCSFAKKRFAKNNKENRHSMHDTGAANYALTLQATSMGIITHQMGGFFVDKANETLGVPEDFEPVSMMAIGFMGDVESAPEELKERQNAERTRKDKQEFVSRVQG